MLSNTSSTPQRHDSDSPFRSPIREPWENYLQFNTESTYNNNPLSPSPHYSEIVYEKPQNSPEKIEKMEEEFELKYEKEQDAFYSEDTNLRELIQEHELSQSSSMRTRRQQGSQEGEENRENERSECSRCHSEEEEEELMSISTRGSQFSDLSSVDGSDNLSYYNFDDNLSTATEQNLEEEVDLRMKALELIQDRPEEEKQYVNQIMPYLVCSMKEVQEKCNLPLTDEMICSIIKDLLYNKELMIGAERKILGELVEKDMDYARKLRPHGMVTEDDLVVQKRKEKKASKGNRNTSNLNHLNENYVSNIFQFTRRNYPHDKEIQRIGNERNVSALNFRNLMASRLTDDIMTRKAKARMVNCGRELIGNIEYWMKDGYFEQCNDREKYILHKEKALRDLALSGQYCREHQKRKGRLCELVPLK